MTKVLVSRRPPTHLVTQKNVSTPEPFTADEADPTTDEDDDGVAYHQPTDPL